MEQTAERRVERINTILFGMMLGISGILAVFAVVAQPDFGIFRGFWAIQMGEAGLITDPICTGGAGGALLNAAALLLLSALLVRWMHLPFSGAALACLFMMAGFALLGKNLVNSTPILLGGWLYARYKREPFSKYLYLTLFGTCLSPLVSFLMLHARPGLRLVSMLVCGVVVGFFLPPVSAYTVRIHQGYNLYNVGFAAGLVGTLLVSIMKSFGYEVDNSLSWTYENNWIVVAYILTLSFVLMAMGWFGIEDKKSIKRIYRHSGRLVADFVLMDGLPVTLFNMGSLGIVATLYILITGGTINGATMGGILTIIGFGAFGKHLRNVIPVVGGVYLGSLVKVWNINDPSVQLAALFGTSLAPISGQFGWPYGLLVGFIHSSMALNTAF